jgi:hypothetical protein
MPSPRPETSSPSPIAKAMSRLSSFGRACVALVLLTVVARTSGAQSGNARITGIVRDSARRPFANIDVVLQPSNRQTQTDSGGRFVFDGLAGGRYTVVARKLGFAPAEWVVEIEKGWRMDVRLVLSERIPMLDTVTVSADGNCPSVRYDGFLCRRRRSYGAFFESEEIERRTTAHVADLFKGLDGFRVELAGVNPVVRTTAPVSGGSGANAISEDAVPRGLRRGCIVHLVDGLPAVWLNRIPEAPGDLVAVEAYARPDSVPKEYQIYTWGLRPDIDAPLAMTGRCSVIVYWTRARLPR